MEQQERNEWARQGQEVQEGLKDKSFWYTDWDFSILAGTMSAAIFAGTYMYVVYGVGAFNEVSIVTVLKAGLDGGSCGAATASGVSFLFARILESSLVGILDLGGSILAGIGTGVSAIFLSMSIKTPIENFGLTLLIGTLLRLAVDGVIVLIRKLTINQGNSTFGIDVMTGADNASGRFLGPLIISSAADVSILIGIDATLGTLGFYTWKKPIAGGAVLGVMISGAVFPVSL